MEAQLEILLQLQDLKAQSKELSEGTATREVEVCTTPKIRQCDHCGRFLYTAPERTSVATEK